MNDGQLVTVKAKYSTLCVDEATYERAVGPHKKRNSNGDAPLTLVEAVNEVLGH
jgi:hypothetical protein